MVSQCVFYLQNPKVILGTPTNNLAEHVYEKQLVSKFFQEKIPDTHKLWFKEVAEDSLYNWDGLDDEKAEKLFGKNFYYVYNTKEWKGDKYLSCEKEFKAGRPCQKAVVPFKATNKGKDTLGQALAGVVGSNYRRDHLSLLEASLNSAKARIFARKVPHSGEKLRSYEKPQCIKNPTLLGTVPIPDEIIFKDRVQSLKQVRPMRYTPSMFTIHNPFCHAN